MFAKLKDGSAICLAEYNGLPEGAVIPKSNGRWTDVEAWIADNGPLEEYEYPPVPPPVKTQFSSRAFMRRLTNAERVAMKTHEDMQVQLWYDELIAADFVDIEDPDTIDATSYGVYIGLFTQSRADEILTPDPVVDEQ